MVQSTEKEIAGNAVYAVAVELLKAFEKMLS
jgi:hypothetical protein